MNRPAGFRDAGADGLDDQSVQGASRGILDGDPVDAVAFFDEDGDGSMVAMTADYPNGKRVEWRRRSRDTTLSFTRTPNPAGIEGRG